MTSDDLDHLLESHDDIEPSSGFTGAVMIAVGHEAWRTPPLRFPWERAALGPLMGVLVGAGASGFVEPAAIASVLPSGGATREILTAIGDLAANMRPGWMALAVLLTVASVGLSSHVAART